MVNIRQWASVICGAIVAGLLLSGLVYVSGDWRGVGDRTQEDATDTGSDTLSPQPSSSTEFIPVEVKVPILVYHYIREPQFGPSDSDRQYEVTPVRFAEQLAYLKREGFTTVHLADIVAAFSVGKPLPEKPVIITFDDGRDNQYTEAFPLLEKFGFTATFFVFTNAMDRPGYMTWDQLAELRDAGMEIGSHGIYHPYLTKLPDEEMQEELVGSRAKLQEMLGVSGDVIAYPFGLHDARVRTAAVEAGYIAGRGLDHVAVFTADDMMALGSYIAVEDVRWFRKIVAGEAK